jgi:hypothetical protein
MLRTLSSSLIAVALLFAAHGGVAAQNAGSVVSSEISLGNDAAEMTLELEGGRRVELSVRDGRARVDGRELGPAPRGGDVDRAWRDLLNRAMESPTNNLPALFASWSAPDGTGRLLQTALRATIAGAALPPAAAASAVPGSDSLIKLNERIKELEQKLEGEDDDWDEDFAPADADERWGGPFRHIWRGLTDIVATLVTYAILFGMGFAVVFFGGRKYLEAVGETARRATLRSWLVGLAASFLVLPVFVLGVVVLLISIVGIPALLVWIPLFPVAVFAAVVLGYLAVAHAAGEALAERRFSGSDWFSRGNSYYFLLTGLGLLVALFLAADVSEMAGPWLGFVHGSLMFFAIVLSWAAATIGLGAVLLTRGGTRPLTVRLSTDAETGDVYAEETHHV